MRISTAKRASPQFNENQTVTAFRLPAIPASIHRSRARAEPADGSENRTVQAYQNVDSGTTRAVDKSYDTAAGGVNYRDTDLKSSSAPKTKAACLRLPSESVQYPLRSAVADSPFHLSRRSRVNISGFRPVMSVISSRNNALTRYAFIGLSGLTP